MKIKDIETIHMSCPIPEEKTWRLGGSRAPDGRTYLPGQIGVKVDLLIVQVVTDDGLTGIGEIQGGDLAAKMRVEQMKPRFIGQDPFDVDLFTRRQPWGLGWPEGRVLAAVNTACWDLMGKATGRPVYQLLGGGHAERIRAYASGGIDWNFVKNPEIIAREARQYLEEGWTAFKFRIPPDDRCLDVIKAAREAVGDEMDLMIEANMRFRTAKQAIRMAKKFERYDPLWFEEPVPAFSQADLRAYQEIRKALPNIPVSGGEGKTSVAEFKPWIDGHAYDIVQQDASYTGLSEAKRIAYLAELEGILCCPHDWGMAVANASNLHLVASIPNHFVLEIQTTWHWGCPPFRAFEGTGILKKPLTLKRGYVEVPKEPGLGIEVDEEACRKFPYKEGPMAVPWEAAF
ncbi:MAG: mandelate racemase/muconate lactonizing enzyme family protein [Candidatus Bathyarchaeia archaeon]